MKKGENNMDFKEKTGRVLKKLAIAIFVLGTLSALFSGIFILVTQGGIANQLGSTSKAYIVRGVLVILIGIFGSFVSYTLVYAFGQLLDNQQAILDSKMSNRTGDLDENFYEGRRHPHPRPGFPPMNPPMGPRPGFEPRPKRKKKDDDVETDEENESDSQ